MHVHLFLDLFSFSSTKYNSSNKPFFERVKVKPKEKALL